MVTSTLKHLNAQVLVARRPSDELLKLNMLGASVDFYDPCWSGDLDDSPISNLTTHAGRIIRKIAESFQVPQLSTFYVRKPYVMHAFAISAQIAPEAELRAEIISTGRNRRSEPSLEDRAFGPQVTANKGGNRYNAEPWNSPASWAYAVFTAVYIHSPPGQVDAQETAWGFRFWM